MKELIIIGGGAAGLAAALAAVRAVPSLPVRVLEAQDKPGRKLLATGNGRCNLTNQDLALGHYHSTSRKQLGSFFRAMPTERTLDFFASLGLYATPDEAGRVYPACRQASMVLEVLLLAVRRAKTITVETGCRVEDIRFGPQGMTVKTEDGRRFRGGAVVLAAGGQAAPKLGGGSSGYELARSLGHSVEPLRPCLTPLRCKGRFFKSLKGVRVLCRAALWAGGKRLAVEAGEIQFTDYGLSGIPALQFSCHFREGAQVSLDLLPGWEEKALEEELKRRLEAHSGEPLEDALLGLLARRVQYALLRELGLDPIAPARQVNARQRSQLLRGLKDWRIPVLGTQGWEQAQVSAGGVSLDEVQEDFSSVFEPRLFLAGEVLDVAGDCGGYNLHWAWCSGMEAGANAAKLCR
jgi:predicted Rossmann fold flavoprotein